MNDIDRQIESINIATKALKVQFGKYYELGALTNSIPLLEELRVLRNTKGKVPIATIKFSKKELQEIVDEKIEIFHTDIQSTRNAAIDEFSERLKKHLNQFDFWKYGITDGTNYDARNYDYMIDEIAEQMKGGAE